MLGCWNKPQNSSKSAGLGWRVSGIGFTTPHFATNRPNDFLKKWQWANLTTLFSQSGLRIPRFCMKGHPLKDTSLEDFALFPHESRQAKESEELPEVIFYIDQWHRALRIEITKSKRSPVVL